MTIKTFSLFSEFCQTKQRTDLTSDNSLIIIMREAKNVCEEKDGGAAICVRDAGVHRALPRCG